MPDLEAQVRAYSEFLVDSVEPVDLDELGAIDEVRRPTRWQPRSVLLAAAVIMLLGISAVMVYRLFDSDAAEPTEVDVVDQIPVPSPQPNEDQGQSLEQPQNGDLVVTWSMEQWPRAEPFPWDSSDVSLAAWVDWAMEFNAYGWDGVGVSESSWANLCGSSALCELGEVSVAGDAQSIVVAGMRRDGTTALYHSVDAGNTWTEVDHSVLADGGGLQVVATTSGGLTWLSDGRTADEGDAEGVLAFIAEDRLVDVHDPPWNIVRCCMPTTLFETGQGVGAIQHDFNDPRLSLHWSYLGDGRWSQGTDIPISADFAQRADTILRFDHANATCCNNPIPGTSFWPLLASDDGISWTEIASLPGSEVHSLHVIAGDSFWVYGPQIGGGGSGIEITSQSTTLHISSDGIDWQPVDVGFAKAPGAVPPTSPATRFVATAGDTIYIWGFDTDDVWVGTVSRR